MDAHERAISPVIGVTLLVAITVILASVAGVVLLGIGDSDEPTPNLTFAIEPAGDDAVLVTMTGGETVSGEELTLYGVTESDRDAFAGGEVRADTGVTVTPTDDEIEIFYNDPDSERADSRLTTLSVPPSVDLS